MPGDRLVDILQLMARHERVSDGRPMLCAVAAELTEVGGAGIALTNPAAPITSLCTSGETARILMDLETTLGEGPCSDAISTDRAIAEADLHGVVGSSWVGYAPSARAAGVRAVFGFPIRIGAIRLGALGLFCVEPGPLNDTQSSNAYLMASVVGRAVLTMQAGAPRGALAEELQRGASFEFVVHQAAGIVAVQGSMSIGDALAALRAHAFASGTSSSALALSVVAREISYDPATREWRVAAAGG